MMTRLLHSLKGSGKGEEGATMVEYGLMLALIAIICIVAVGAIGTSASALFNTVGNTL
jgi:pilus assembly protein Flp/PilA